MDAKFIKGKITIVFTKELVPEITFEGDVAITDMFPLPFHISTAYQEHLNKLGDALKKKLAQKGLEPEVKPVTANKDK